MIRLVAAAGAAAIAVGCAGGGESVPEWVQERADAAVEPYRDLAEVEATEYVEGEREWRVVHALDRIVPCHACSRPRGAAVQRGNTLEHRWDKRTRRRTLFALCTSGGADERPLNGCDTSLR